MLGSWGKVQQDQQSGDAQGSPKCEPQKPSTALTSGRKRPVPLVLRSRTPLDHESTHLVVYPHPVPRLGSRTRSISGPPEPCSLTFLHPRQPEPKEGLEYPLDSIDLLTVNDPLLHRIKGIRTDQETIHPLNLPRRPHSKGDHYDGHPMSPRITPRSNNRGSLHSNLLPTDDMSTSSLGRTKSLPAVKFHTHSKAPYLTVTSHSHNWPPLLLSRSLERRHGNRTPQILPHPLNVHRTTNQRHELDHAQRYEQPPHDPRYCSHLISRSGAQNELNFGLIPAEYESRQNLVQTGRCFVTAHGSASF